MSYYPPNNGAPLDDYAAAPAYTTGPPPGPHARRGRTPAPPSAVGAYDPQSAPAAPYDNYGNQAFGQPDAYGGAPPAPAAHHDPFAGGDPYYNQQQQPDPLHQQHQWAQPVAHQPYDPALGDPNQYGHQLPPMHPQDSFVSQAPSDPFGNQHQQVLQHQDDDDDNGQAPLLAQGTGGGHHPRWSSGGAGNGYGNGTGGNFAGGFDPNVVGLQGAGMDDDQQSVVRYGRIPQRQPRRYKTVKRVQLYHGNLVLDCQVPPKLLERCPRKDDREFTHMRYTAATCDPNDFLDEQYALRQILYETPRRTELFIVMTMYNEDEVLFCRTMHGVMKNIQHLCERTRSKTWGADGWKKVVVCIVSDGRAKINSRTLSVLAAMGVYQDGVAKNVVAGKPVTAHIYEYTTQLSVAANADGDLQFKSADRGLVPVQILFCLKEKNAKKINSHRWFFNAFGPILQPNVCVLLDVGTQPGSTSIYKLWKTFDLNSNVGGACGEIVALKGKYFRNLLNPLVAAQNFEYKMSNILDKPLESVFGYITVLPGAFSAYRYIALQNDSMGEGPLKEYFKGETLHHSNDTDLWTKNMYLAEDRILCWELVAKRGSAWLLHYQRSAYAVTDVPDRLHDLIAQRRRWLNGSFFASLHSIFHFGYLYRSDHSFGRKLWLHVELFYQTYNMLFTWFGLANWYIIFVILTTSLESPEFNLGRIDIFNLILKYYYIGIIGASFVLALGNRPAGSRIWYNTIAWSLAGITSYLFAAAIIITVKGIQNAKAEEGGGFDVTDIFTNATFRNIVISLLATYGLWLLASLIFLDPAHMFTSILQYMLMAPSFIHIVQTYSFCNVQDVTWGNRPEEKQQTDLGVAPVKDGGVDVVLPSDEKDINAAYDDACHVLATKAAPEVQKVDPETKMLDSYRNIRTNVVLAWSLTNGALVAGILSTSAGDGITSTRVNVYMAFLLYSVAGLAAFKFVGSTLYSIMWLFQS